VIVWLPTARVEVVNVAVPELTEPVPSVAAPSKKVTVPVFTVAVDGELAVTVPVKVTGWPKTAGFADELMVVVVLAAFTVCVREDEVLALKLASPPYDAVMVWLAAANVAIVNVVLPEVNIAVPRVEAPSRKVTLPVGVPVAGDTGLTVAAKVADWPNTVGLIKELSAVMLLPDSRVRSSNNSRLGRLRIGFRRSLLDRALFLRTLAIDLKRLKRLPKRESTARALRKYKLL
jgi:hypothetical protein